MQVPQGFKILAALACLAPVFAVSESHAADAVSKRLLNKSRKTLEQAIRQGDARTAIEQIKELGALNSPDAAEYLLTLESVRSWDVFDAAREALPGDGGEEMQQALLEFYKREANPRGNWKRRVMLIDVFEKLPGEAAAEALRRGVNDANPKVRLAAIRALKKADLPIKVFIPTAIDALAVTEEAGDVGLPHVAAREALHKRTGQDFPNAAAWRKFWEAQGEDFLPPDDDVQGSISYSKEVTYFDDVVLSRRVLFVIDTSASMNIIEYRNWPNTPRTELTLGTPRGRGADNSGATITSPEWKLWVRKNPECVRMARAKGELARMVESLPAHAYFNIISFNTRVRPWKKTMTPASEPAKKNAFEFIQGLFPDGATAADLALAEAFDNNQLADTIYFLSDGQPSRDGVNHLPPQPIIDSLDYHNRFHRSTIHTLGFGGEGAEFLGAMAKMTGGEYRPIVGPPKLARKIDPRERRRR